jgi:hypothetical protein
MPAAGTNKPEGPRYNKLFGTWLKNHGFDDIDESDRKRLFDVARAPLRSGASPSPKPSSHFPPMPYSVALSVGMGFLTI